MTLRIRMAVMCVAAVCLFTASVTDAASYQKNDGSIVDPILYVSSVGGANHPYSGQDLQPGAYLDNVDLTSADLFNADLAGRRSRQALHIISGCRKQALGGG